jgi:ADP-ribose pyrophosphatase
MSEARLLSRRRIYEGRVVRLHVEEVRLPNGRVHELEIVRHPGAAAVVPVLEDGRVVLVRQFRHAAGGWILEVPAGKLDGAESPESCAAREVEEEVGYRASRMDGMGWIWTTPGFTDERIWLYLARGLTPTRQSLQEDEVLTVETIPLETAIDMAAHGEIGDAKSVVALFRARQILAR